MANAKLKTHTGAKKRFRFSKNGKIKHSHAYKSHLLNGHGKSPKRKMSLRQATYVDVTNTVQIKKLMPYA